MDGWLRLVRPVGWVHAGHRSTIDPMQVATGTVVNGKIVLEGVLLAEGAKVTVVTRGADEGFTLSASQEDALVASLAEIERGEFVNLEDLLASLPRHG
jgi:riboflavin synthase alpha subunit